MFILDTDARNIEIGAVLSQVQDKEEKVIRKNHCTTRKKLLEIVKAI